MNDNYWENGKSLQAPGRNGSDYRRWRSVLERHGFKARRYLPTQDGEFVASAEGWFRLSPIYYEETQLQWVQNILRYLDERSFANWAAPWQKNLVWEEDEGWRLMQPWIFGGEHFSPADPAGIERVAEILADLHRCGRGYPKSEARGEMPEQWRSLNHHWQIALEWMDALPEDQANEEVRPELAGVRKAIAGLLKENVAIWQNGIHLLFEADDLTGSIGHGRLRGQDIVWLDNDFYLLNWENVTAQPRVADLAVFIENVGLWEPEWIILLINAYTQKQPLWPEEFQALKLVLEYPKGLLELLREDRLPILTREEMELTRKGLQRKSQCLAGVWPEVAAAQRWNDRIWLGNGGIGPEKLFPETSRAGLWEAFADDRNDRLNAGLAAGSESTDQLERLIGFGRELQPEEKIEKSLPEERSGKWSLELIAEELMAQNFENDQAGQDEKVFKAQGNAESYESVREDALREEVFLNPEQPEILVNTGNQSSPESTPAAKDDPVREEPVLSWRSFPKTLKR